MKFHQFLLYPAALLFQSITAARNKLYQTQVFKQQRFALPVLVVGNLAVGGTGKTPHTEYLIRLLKNYRRLAVLSRGYKRKTTGFILAGPADNAATIGDEPMLYHSQFPEVRVAVGEKRPEAIARLLQLNPAPEVILLDDAFQHRPLQASFYLLLTDFVKPFYQDLVLPAGRLRESAHGASRANAVVVTKCPPAISEKQMLKIKAEIARYAKPGTPVFFSAYAYGKPVCLNMRTAELPKKLILVTAIANPGGFAAALKEMGYELLHQATYPDHYAYTNQDMEKLARLVAESQQAYPREIGVVTTSKDAIKLQQPELLSAMGSVPVFYVPVEVKILNNEEQAFNQMAFSAAGITEAQT